MSAEINHIEIPHERMLAPGGILTENEQTTLRSELGKLMWIARIARPGAIYDASASAQTFSAAEMMDFLEEEEEESTLSENEEKIALTEEEDFDHMPGFAEFKSRRQAANKANILKTERSIRQKRILRYEAWFLKKGDSEIEGRRYISN